MNIIDSLLLSKFVSSKKEGERLIKGGGVKFDGVVVPDRFFECGDGVLSVGKKNKIRIEGDKIVPVEKPNYRDRSNDVPPKDGIPGLEKEYDPWERVVEDYENIERYKDKEYETEHKTVSKSGYYGLIGLRQIPGGIDGMRIYYWVVEIFRVSPDIKYIPPKWVDEFKNGVWKFVLNKGTT